MKLCLESITKDAAAWAAKGVALPKFDIAAMRAQTKETPEWVHFGAGNIFRGFIGSLSQRLLNEGLAKTGIIACDTFDYEVIDKIYTAYDSLTLNVLLNPDGTTTREVLAGVAEGLKADFSDAASAERLRSIFRAPSLKMLSFTITEKGYALRRPDGSLMPVVEADMANGPAAPRHVMAIVAALLLERYNAGKLPMAVVSMDNCSHNGEKLMKSVLEVAEAWKANGFVDDGFIAYLRDESKVSFPWSMIDKITPRPHPRVEESLAADGFEGMAPVVTDKKTFIAAFVNAEKPQYLVVEDKFPNGRPPLEKAGVYFCDRETVNMTERMKVTTCLNPLHTALAVSGCLLGYRRISEEMKDPELSALARGIGYDEGLPVVTDPGVIHPKEFLDTVVNVRIPNPFLPDTPQRIATDTSQKVPIRFGETIKSYAERPDLDPKTLTCIPLAIALWLRYLLAVDDEGNAFVCSPDPMLETLQAQLAGVKPGDSDSASDALLAPILSNAAIFGVDLVAAGLAPKISAMLRELLTGKGAVRATLKKYLNH